MMDYNNWIGKKGNKSGTYVQTAFKELMIRRGGPINAEPLYKFTTFLDMECYISDPEILHKIDYLLTEDEGNEYHRLRLYLYDLLVEHAGVGPFLQRVERKLSSEWKAGYSKGQQDLRKEMRSLLGVR